MARASIDRAGFGGAVAAALIAANLAACSSFSGDTAAKIAYAPGHFDLYTCQDLDELTIQMRKRQAELEQLMARAEQGTGGAFVSAIAYRSEYVQARGELVDLKRVATEKQCAIGNKYSSGRAIF